MNCSNCGNKITKTSKFCSNCGFSVNENTEKIVKESKDIKENNFDKDSNSVGYFFLGLFFPLICIIIYFCIGNKPNMKRKLLSGSITGFIVWTILSFVFVYLFIKGIFSIVLLENDCDYKCNGNYKINYRTGKCLCTYDNKYNNRYNYRYDIDDDIFGF